MCQFWSGGAVIVRAGVMAGGGQQWRSESSARTAAAYGFCPATHGAGAADEQFRRSPSGSEHQRHAQRDQRRAATVVCVQLDQIELRSGSRLLAVRQRLPESAAGWQRHCLHDDLLRADGLQHSSRCGDCGNRHNHCRKPTSPPSAVPSATGDPLVFLEHRAVRPSKSSTGSADPGSFSRSEVL